MRPAQLHPPPAVDDPLRRPHARAHQIAQTRTEQLRAAAAIGTDVCPGTLSHLAGSSLIRDSIPLAPDPLRWRLPSSPAAGRPLSSAALRSAGALPPGYAA